MTLPKIAFRRIVIVEHWLHSESPVGCGYILFLIPFHWFGKISVF